MNQVFGIEKICSSCRTRFRSCQHCWRGQKYCSSLCSKASRQKKLRINNQRYSGSKKGLFNGRRRQHKFRLKNKNLEIVTDQSTNKFKEALNLGGKISERKGHKNHCCLCGKKINHFRRASEMSDGLNFNFSFRRYLKARGLLW